MKGTGFVFSEDAPSLREEQAVDASQIDASNMTGTDESV